MPPPAAGWGGPARTELAPETYTAFTSEDLMRQVVMEPDQAKRN